MYTNPDLYFSDPVPDFYLVWILARGKKYLSGSRQKILDPKHCIFYP